jgi:hypothetical protein
VPLVAAARRQAPYRKKRFEQSFQHPFTDQELEGFLKDWEKARETLGDVFQPAAARKPGR